MKHAHIIIFLLCIFPLCTSAQEENLTIPQKHEEIKQKIEEKINNLQTQIEEKRVEIKEQIRSTQEDQQTKLQILAQERVSKIITQIFEQFEAMIVKFDGIILRVENRISKLDEENIDTTQSKELLLESKEKLEEATALIAATKLELQTMLLSEISKEQIKTSIVLCKDSLKEVKQSLVHVINSIKIVGDLSLDTVFIEE
jgi:hypothetical protein